MLFWNFKKLWNSGTKYPPPCPLGCPATPTIRVASLVGPPKWPDVMWSLENQVETVTFHMQCDFFTLQHILFCYAFSQLTLSLSY